MPAKEQLHVLLAHDTGLHAALNNLKCVLILCPHGKPSWTCYRNAAIRSAQAYMQRGSVSLAEGLQSKHVATLGLFDKLHGSKTSTAQQAMPQQLTLTTSSYLQLTPAWCQRKNTKHSSGGLNERLFEILELDDPKSLCILARQKTQLSRLHGDAGKHVLCR